MITKSVLAKSATGEIQLTITIPAAEIKKTYDQVFADIAKETEISGFRKGKAPKKLVEEKADKSKIYEQVVQKVIPQAYVEAVEEHKIKPILSPRVELLKAKEGEDWEVRAITCERPKVELGDYKEVLRKELAPSKIWTPNEKNQTEEKPGENAEEERTQKMMQILLQTVKVDLPAVLIEDELNRTLAHLLNQTEKLGLTVDQYLSSIGKSVEQLRGEYREKIENDLKLQLTLDEVAKEEKIEVRDEEIDGLIAATGDEKLKQDLNAPREHAYLAGIIARRKALDFLVKL